MDFKTKLDNYVDSYEQQGYLQGSLLIADKTGILLEQGFGSASIEYNVANTSDTKFQIGSLTKAFTSMALLILQQHGALSLDDSIDRYLSGFPNGEKITIYHCMTCTSGIPDFASFDHFWETTMRLSWTLDDMLDLFKELPLEFEPGSQFSYSSSGYLVLTKIIEVITGQTYAQFLEKEIFTPLNMTSTGCMNETDIILNLASSYSYWEKEINTPQTNNSFPLGAYGLYSTTRDLYLWDQAIRKNQLIPEHLTTLLFTVNQDSYACGWDIAYLNTHRYRQHFGNISGFVSSIKQFEEEDLTIILLSNLDVIPVTTITKEIARLKFDSDFAPATPLSPITKAVPLEKFVGYYKTANATLFEIVVQKDSLFLIVPKLYEINYKFRLKLVQSSNETLVFATEKINESITFIYKDLNNFEKILYTDCQGITIPLTKQNDTAKASAKNS
ncbi:serine hydrolase domain-containing protein [Enterococcus crotali]|uniref:serine hydrolase domain-containing protein n=1 Tax=Enterococcus crotali TaxID=1453587 RepID=UPI000471FF3F|nr:serine hydrolase domain-containing protein [Enterococcus crotali]